MKPTVKNMDRIQRALEELQKLTPEQMNTLSSQQNFNELRLARLNNLKFQIFQNQNDEKQKHEGNQLNFNSQKSQTYNKNGGQSGVKWPSFKEMPILRAKQSQRNYQKEFANRIEEFRRDVRKQQQKKFHLSNQNSIQNPSKSQSRDNGIFSAVFNNQTGPNLMNTQNQQKQQISFLNVQNPAKYSSHFDVSALTPKGPLFGGQWQNKPQQISFPQRPFLFSPLKPNYTETPIPQISNVPAQNINDKNLSGFQIPKKKQGEKQKKEVIGFVPGSMPNQVSSSIFERKFQTPQPSPPAPINKNASLFSQSNPLSLKNLAVASSSNPFHINESKSKEANAFQLNQKSIPQSIQPKFNIFEKRFNVQECQPVKPIQLKGGLFSSSNPWASNTQSVNKNNTQSLMVDTNKTNQNHSQKHVGNNLAQIPKQVHHQHHNKNIKQQISLNAISSTPFTINAQNSDSKQSSMNKNPIPDSQHNVFQNTITDKQAKGGQSKLFENVTIKPNDNKFSLFSSEPSKLQKPTYQSGSLFTNNLKGADEEKQTSKALIKSAAPEKLPNNQQLNKANSSNEQKKNQISKPDQLKKEEQSNQKIDNKPGSPANVFLRGFQNEKNIFKNPGAANMKPLDSNIFKQHLGGGNGSGFLKGTQQSSAPNQIGKPIDSKKPNQTFGQLSKPKPDNMFSQNRFGNTPPSGNTPFGSTPTNNMFGNPVSQGGSMFPQQSMSFFPTQNDDEQDQIEGDDEDNILQDKSQIDPSKSTGNYKYQESVVLFRQTALKIKKGSQSVIENASISIQKVPGNLNYTLIIRLANKVIYFTGTILPGVSQIGKINEKEFKNLRATKIVCFGDDKKPVSQQIKIQFKEQKIGNTFFNQFNEACKK